MADVDTAFGQINVSVQIQGKDLAAAQSGIEHDHGRKRHIMLPHTLHDQFALILGNGPVGPLVALGPPELMTWIGKNDMIVQGSCKNAVDGHAVFIDIGLAFAGYLVEQQTNFGRCDLFDGKRTDPLAGMIDDTNIIIVRLICTICLIGGQPLTGIVEEGDPKCVRTQPPRQLLLEYLTLFKCLGLCVSIEFTALILDAVPSV